jgi:hypothetical protein
MKKYNNTANNINIIIIYKMVSFINVLLTPLAAFKYIFNYVWDKINTNSWESDPNLLFIIENENDYISISKYSI